MTSAAMVALVAELRHPGRSGLGSLSPRRCAHALHVDGVAVSLTTALHGQLVWHPIWLSDQLSLRLDDLRFQVGEGPSVDAVTDQQKVLVPDLATTQERWPLFTPAAIDLGVQAKFAFPLATESPRTLGTFVAHRRDVGEFTLEEIDDAETFADAATHALLRTDDDDPDATPRWLPAQCPTRPEVHQAVGILAHRLEIDTGEAMIRLRAYAYAQRRSMSDIAFAILNGDDIFDRRSDP